MPQLKAKQYRTDKVPKTGFVFFLPLTDSLTDRSLFLPTPVLLLASFLPPVLARRGENEKTGAPAATLSS